MQSYRTLAAAVGAAALTGLVLSQVYAGGDKVAFPADYEKGALYTTQDRPDVKQFRELRAPQAVIDAVKAGRPIPSGAVLTMVNYAAQLDAQGNPIKDANGRLVKGNVVAIFVMEKRTGWGTEYPDNVRNGEWEYQAFTPAKQPNATANLTACFTCHKARDKDDFVFSLDRIKAASR